MPCRGPVRGGDVQEPAGGAHLVRQPVGAEGHGADQCQVGGDGDGGVAQDGGLSGRAAALDLRRQRRHGAPGNGERSEDYAPMTRSEQLVDMSVSR